MKPPEAFGLFRYSTASDAETHYSRLQPRLNEAGQIAYEAADGSNLRSVEAQDVTQTVSTLEDLNDLVAAMRAASKQKVHTSMTGATMTVTDARVIFSKASPRNPQEQSVGHVRFPWVNAITWRRRAGWLTPARVVLWMVEDFPVRQMGTWYHYVTVEFAGDVDTEALSLDLARRISAHNLMHGAPPWAHDDLVAATRMTRLPDPGDDGEGMWEAPAWAPCPTGIDYIDDGSAPTRWSGPHSPEETAAASSADGREAGDDAADASGTDGRPDHTPPSTLIYRRMLQRGKHIARDRGSQTVEPADLLLALLLDEEDTPAAGLLTRYGVDYQRFQAELVRERPIEGTVVSGKYTMPVGIGARLVRLTSHFETVRDEGDIDSTLATAREIVDLAEESATSTARAFGNLLQGEAYFSAGRYDDAQAAYAAVKTLRRGSVVTVIRGQAPLQPLEIMDDALIGLCRAAEKRGDADAELRAMEILCQFRADYPDTPSGYDVALKLARRCVAKHDPETLRWTACARAELPSDGPPALYADVLTLEAEALVDLGSTDRARAVAEQAVLANRAAGDAHAETYARFLHARAIAASEPAVAWNELLEVLPSTRADRTFLARRILIALAEIDAAAAAPIAETLTRDSLPFYGPRAAEIAVDGARNLLPDQRDQARPLLFGAVRISRLLLEHPDSSDGDVDRAFASITSAFTAAADDHAFTEPAATAVLSILASIDADRLWRRECYDLVWSMSTIDRFDLQERLARGVLDRVADSGREQRSPNPDQLAGIAIYQANLSQALRRMGRLSEAIEAQAEAVAVTHRAAVVDPGRRVLLSHMLSAQGTDLMRAERYAEADRVHEETIILLRQLVASGGDRHRQALVDVLLERAVMDNRLGHLERKRMALDEAEAVLADSGDADWTARYRAKLDSERGSAS